MRWSEQELRDYQNRNKNKKIIKTNNKKSKYKNIRVKIDGHTFDSKKESEYYLKLKNQLQMGIIKCFAVQPKFLLPGGIIYKADFMIIDNDDLGKVIDIKGFETKEFKLKEKLFNNYFNYKLEVIK